HFLRFAASRLLVQRECAAGPVLDSQQLSGHHVQSARSAEYCSLGSARSEPYRPAAALLPGPRRTEPAPGAVAGAGEPERAAGADSPGPVAATLQRSLRVSASE